MERKIGNIKLVIDEAAQGELFICESKDDLMKKLDEVIDNQTFEVKVMKRNEPQERGSFQSF